MNTAYTKGTNAKSYDAVAGTATTVSEIEDSTLNVRTVAGNNVAFSTLSSTTDTLDNDAVAGS